MHDERLPLSWRGAQPLDVAAAPRDPRAASETATRARRHRRQNLTLLALASGLGLWLGTGAPEISPVAPPTQITVQSVSPVPAGNVSSPTGTSPDFAITPPEPNALIRVRGGHQ